MCARTETLPVRHEPDNFGEVPPDNLWCGQPSVDPRGSVKSSPTGRQCREPRTRSNRPAMRTCSTASVCRCGPPVGSYEGGEMTAPAQVDGNPHRVVEVFGEGDAWQAPARGYGARALHGTVHRVPGPLRVHVTVRGRCHCAVPMGEPKVIRLLPNWWRSALNSFADRIDIPLLAGIGRSRGRDA